jgi:MerR family copper efflux transcriptional regulator
MIIDGCKGLAVAAPNVRRSAPPPFMAREESARRAHVPALDLAPWGQPYPPSMKHEGLLVGELVKRGGVTRKALRIYEAGDILPAARRTRAGYRVYELGALRVVAFVKQAQSLGFRLEEIREIVAIRRSGRAPCPHVKRMLRQKLRDLDTLRKGLLALHRSWDSRRDTTAAVCPHIEHSKSMKSKGGEQHGN